MISNQCSGEKNITLPSSLFFAKNSYRFVDRDINNDFEILIFFIPHSLLLFFLLLDVQNILH
jgi:hypothetical protein